MTKPLVDDLYKAMAESRGSAPTDEEKSLISHAYTFAEQAHTGQARASGEPYFNHVFETGKNCARFGMDAVTIAAGMLHDVIEDTTVTEDELKKEFGADILFLVLGVTKLGKVKYRGRERSIESLRKFFLAVAEDIRVVVIKLADRLHNVSTLSFLKPDKAKRIALETIEIHAPLAHRLGMGKLRNELEEFAFPFAYPKEYTMVSEVLKQRKQLNEQYTQKVYRSLKKEMALQGIKDVKTEYRIKHKFSLWKKLKRKDMDIEKIHDIVALRVLVPTLEDCYRVLGIIHGMWRPLPGRIKDYIALPKPNGYQSLQTTIFTGDGGIAEVQIRTPEMHRQAEYGFASHFMYKQKMDKKSIKKNYPWLADLTDLQHNETDPAKLYDSMRGDFFDHRIFVFTPSGEVVDLPEGSTAIDFAFAIHSDIGLHATGAKVNGKYVALKTELRGGDIIEITQNETGKPSNKWLDFAKTSLAKRHIRNYLKDHSLLDSFLGRIKN
ncbi:MAG: bifunctional (p)ppGpp synthetase/guanosine-3',5'-bis(diphosphate) 3'-pyrophosphohydrolase [Candidatus Pacebacteria bacterium]|nr:bifunctional (p)ppGpp synthetase/guanosine-3',5'-bis(diphosphate) 3'-pyrophosphohydrolase [Candidatus Paceibacterota bacterium]